MKSERIALYLYYVWLPHSDQLCCGWCCSKGGTQKLRIGRQQYWSEGSPSDLNQTNPAAGPSVCGCRKPRDVAPGYAGEAWRITAYHTAPFRSKTFYPTRYQETHLCTLGIFVGPFGLTVRRKRALAFAIYLWSCDARLP